MNESPIRKNKDGKIDYQATISAALKVKIPPAFAERKLSDERNGLPSASAWHRYELCHGSYQLGLEAKRLGQEAYAEPSPEAKRGQLIHAYLAGEVDEDGNEIKLASSEQTTADFLQERAQGEVKRIFGDEKVEQLDEKRLWDPQHRFSGRFDRVIWSETLSLALIQDFKTGWASPETGEDGEVNAQMKVLAVLVGIALPTVKEIVTQLVTGPFGIYEQKWTWVPSLIAPPRIKDLGKAYGDVIKTLKAITAERASFAPSAEACRYCPALNICQATKDLILPLTKLSYSALPQGERAAKLLDECELLLRHLEEIRAYYRRQIEADPAAVPGWGLEQGAPRRAVEDWPAARAKLEEFIDEAKLDALACYSIPAVEKLLGEAIGVRGAKLKEQFGLVLGPLLEQKYPAPSLKRLKGSCTVKPPWESIQAV